MKKFGFQTVETKPNKKVWISDSWDPTEHSNFRHWDQTEQKSSNFRHLGPNRTKKLGFQTVGTKPNFFRSDFRQLGPNQTFFVGISDSCDQTE